MDSYLYQSYFGYKLSITSDQDGKYGEQSQLYNFQSIIIYIRGHTVTGKQLIIYIYLYFCFYICIYYALHIVETLQQFEVLVYYLFS